MVTDVGATKRKAITDDVAAFFIAMPGLCFEDALRMGLSSVAETEAMAWRKHVGIREGIEASWDSREISRRIQAWFDKGYRVKRITISEMKDGL